MVLGKVVLKKTHLKFVGKIIFFNPQIKIRWEKYSSKIPEFGSKGKIFFISFRMKDL